MSLVFDHYPRGGGELLTALALADHADHDGNNVRPGIAGLARKTRQSERTVQNHLARMRRDRWMLPVRYPNGGFGRATEYRVNPEWLKNPVDFAPFSRQIPGDSTVQPEATTVQAKARKGASDDNLRCNDAAPQPSGIVNEPTTTAPAVGSTGPVVVGDGLKLVEFPLALRGPWLESATLVVESCPASLRQQVVNEVAGIVARGKLRGSPIGLLHRLVDRAVAGTFVPSVGIPFAERQRLQAAARARGLEARLQASVPLPVPAGDIAREMLAKIRATLAKRD
jgi:hypothetical protein